MEQGGSQGRRKYNGDPDEAVFWKEMALSVLSDGGEVVV